MILFTLLSSTNINQSAPNLVKVYMTIGSQMRLIMELSEFSALDLENVPYLPFVYTLASANIDQSILNLATIYMPIRSRMSLIVGQIVYEHPEFLALEFGKIAGYYCLLSIIDKYWLISTKLGQNVCDHKISDGFDYGSNWTRTVPSYLPLN